MNREQTIKKVETLLKSGTEDNINLAMLLSDSQQLDYNFHKFGELGFFLAEYTRFNPHLPIEQMIKELMSYGWYELEDRGINELPETFGLFMNLRTLHLESNQLTDLPNSFSKLTELKKLHLGMNPFKKLPQVICQLPKLELLDLFHTQLNSLPIKITELKKLKQLNLRGNSIEAEELEKIKTLLPNTQITF
jgi:hypothetical protein